MSRQATAQAAKKEQKAAIAAKNAEKERLAELGMNKTIKQAIGDDVLLCTACGATQRGPIECECKGGKVRPGPGYEVEPQLIAAAKARIAAGKQEDRLLSSAQQAAISKERSKKKEGRENERNDLDAEYQGDNGVECLEVREFPVGKFGMDIEKTSINKVSDPPSNAADLGVKVGWVIYKVNGTVVKEKKAIVKEASAGMKVGPVQFAFRVPLLEGYFHCADCDKFLTADQFDDSQIAAGPGKQRCVPCDEVAGMEGDY
eukprot:gnl/MRDRNA2_/MRDRNA2_27865_c0_seq2.p1 gnl/MRDRNA2_/MRDRNA2_27865_c0~~gnl/MRDRNA2_/MRDRNA2_27865_c0_seq2.p1  ORF type:complete len:259 (+),score=69.81 gnl/MRDRNA2_/MRDRNA2_27865_c0_seq2:115-891(+)